MSESPEEPTPYQVVYSDDVIAVFRDLGAKAVRVGRWEEFTAAMRELHRLLRIYPQFGEPAVDLTYEVEQTYRGAVSQLVVHYAVLEERRIVFVTKPPELLPYSSWA